MRKFATYAAAWLAAAVVAMAVAWQGVELVTRQVTADRPSSLAADDLRDLAREPTEPEVSTTVAPPGSAAPPSTAPPTTTRPVTTTTAAPRPAGTPVTTTITTAPPPPPPAAETRTYNVVGGSVALRFTPDGVSVLWATPNDGFEVDVETENTNGVRVEFESETHRSRVDGWWAGGPQDSVREEDD